MAPLDAATDHDAARAGRKLRSRKKNQGGALVVSNRVVVAVVEHQPIDRTYVAKRIATGEVVAIAPDRHEAQGRARGSWRSRRGSPQIRPQADPNRLSSADHAHSDGTPTERNQEPPAKLVV